MPPVGASVSIACLIQTSHLPGGRVPSGVTGLARLLDSTVESCDPLRYPVGPWLLRESRDGEANAQTVPTIVSTRDALRFALKIKGKDDWACACAEIIVCSRNAISYPIG